MFNSSTGACMWRREWDWPRDNITALFYQRKVLLTDSICAFYYIDGNWETDSESYVNAGNMTLKILDPKTGKEMHNKACFPFLWWRNGAHLEEAAPFAVAGGNDVCVANLVSMNKQWKGASYRTKEHLKMFSSSSTQNNDPAEKKW